MRNSNQTVTTAIKQLLPKDTHRSFYMIRNNDTLNSIFLQFGESAGSTVDFLEVRAGETFTLDPNKENASLTHDRVWAYGAASVSTSILAG